MAQWVPKTAWKLSNLNKRYGLQYTLGSPGQPLGEEHYRRAQTSAQAARVTKLALHKALSSLLTERGRAAGEPCTLNRTVILDVRDAPQRQLQMLSLPIATALHTHDILSGAALPLLPLHNKHARLFVLAGSTQRAFSACAALHRWGYDNVMVVDYAIVTEALSSVVAEREQRRVDVRDTSVAPGVR